MVVVVVTELVLGGPGASPPWEVEDPAEPKGACGGMIMRLSGSFALPRRATIPVRDGGAAAHRISR